MKDTQHAVREMVGNFVASNTRAEIAVGGLLVAIAIFAVGCGCRKSTSAWFACAVRVVGLLLGVSVLALQAGSGGWLTGVDHSAMAWLVTHRNPAIDHLALAVTNALGPLATAVLTAVVAVVVGLRSRSVHRGLTVVVSVSAASLLCWMVKQAVERPRPPILIQETLETDYSFPSGHVTGIAALFGILAVVVGVNGSRLAKISFTAVAAVAVSAVALSRLYLGVHWLSDVIAGVLLAAAVVSIGATVLRTRLPRTDPTKPELSQQTSASKALL